MKDHINAYGTSDDDIGKVLSIQRERIPLYSKLVPTYTNFRVMFSSLSLDSSEDILVANNMLYTEALGYISEKYDKLAKRRYFMPSISRAIILERAVNDSEFRGALQDSGTLELRSYAPDSLTQQTVDKTSMWYTRHLMVIRGAMQGSKLPLQPLVTSIKYITHLPVVGDTPVSETKAYIEDLIERL